MVNTCFSCKYRGDKFPRRSFHKFPSDEELKQKWLDILGKSNMSIGKSTTLCQIHFEKDCFRYGQVYGTRILKAGSLPTLHLRERYTENQAIDPNPEVEPPNFMMENIRDMPENMNAKNLAIGLTPKIESPDFMVGNIYEMQNQTNVHTENSSIDLITKIEPPDFIVDNIVEIQNLTNNNSESPSIEFIPKIEPPDFIIELHHPLNSNTENQAIDITPKIEPPDFVMEKIFEKQNLKISKTKNKAIEMTPKIEPPDFMIENIYVMQNPTDSNTENQAIDIIPKIEPPDFMMDNMVEMQQSTKNSNSENQAIEITPKIEPPDFKMENIFEIQHSITGDMQMKVLTSELKIEDNREKISISDLDVSRSHIKVPTEICSSKKSCSIDRQLEESEIIRLKKKVFTLQRSEKLLRNSISRMKAELTKLKKRLHKNVARNKSMLGNVTLGRTVSKRKKHRWHTNQKL